MPHHHIGAGRRQRPRGLRAEPARRAGHDRDPAAKVDPGEHLGCGGRRRLAHAVAAVARAASAAVSDAPLLVTTGTP